ncbi:MAG: FAD-dependent monooxygenase [Chloroflexi bacterium]|nr:FAD-dependent monooxygenase [Chloroflexota bacterium]
MTERYDLIVVGGGIAGGALATVMAREGQRVLVLERTTEYRDNVRGEWMAPWGVVEATKLGLYDMLLQGGGLHIARHVPYSEGVDPAEAEAGTMPLSAFVPGVPGPLTLGHPATCAILDRSSRDSGATVLRGVTDVKVHLGAAPSVSYVHEGATHDAACRLIVGADGRNSAVRPQTTIALHRDPAHHLFSGMLVEGATGWAQDTEAIGVEGDVNWFIFPQLDGRIRLYLGYSLEQKDRLAGPDAQQRFLDAFRLKCVPGIEAIAEAKPAGPCNSFPNADSWTDVPFVEGLVLVGDAAGWNDPITGQGLSIAMRDVRIVSDLLKSASDWKPSLFAPYAEERAERMRRLRFRASVSATLECEFDAAARERRKSGRERWTRDPAFFPLLLVPFVGPEIAPPEAFTPEARARLLAP